jgi:hypothetical protein
VALAKSEAPHLGGVHVQPDGSLEGLTALTSETVVVEAYALVLAHLLGLLVTFIGERLTLQLVRDLWPELPSVGTFNEAQRT